MNLTLITHDEECSLILEKSLPMRGFKVARFKTYDEGSEHIEKNTPNMVIVDISQENSQDFLKLMQSAYPQLPLVVLSPDNSSDTIDNAIDLGVKHYVITPFDLTGLIERIQTIIAEQKEKEQKQEK